MTYCFAMELADVCETFECEEPASLAILLKPIVHGLSVVVCAIDGNREPELSGLTALTDCPRRDRRPTSRSVLLGACPLTVNKLSESSLPWQATRTVGSRITIPATVKTTHREYLLVVDGLSGSQSQNLSPDGSYDYRH